MILRDRSVLVDYARGTTKYYQAACETQLWIVVVANQALPNNLPAHGVRLLLDITPITGDSDMRVTVFVKFRRRNIA